MGMPVASSLPRIGSGELQRLIRNRAFMACPDAHDLSTLDFSGDAAFTPGEERAAALSSTG
jgi:hypothetical protein